MNMAYYAFPARQNPYQPASFGTQSLQKATLDGRTSALSIPPQANVTSIALATALLGTLGAVLHYLFWRKPAMLSPLSLPTPKPNTLTQSKASMDKPKSVPVEGSASHHQPKGAEVNSGAGEALKPERLQKEGTNRWPSKKMVAAGLILAVPVAAFLGRNTFAKIAPNMTSPIWDTFYSNVKYAGSTFFNWLKSIPNKDPGQDALDNFRKQYFHHVTELPKVDCENELGVYIDYNLKGSKCLEMQEGLKEIGIQKIINNLSPDKDTSLLQKTFRAWSAKNHPDKGGNTTLYAKVSSAIQDLLKFLKNEPELFEDFQQADLQAYRRKLVASKRNGT